MKKHDLSLILIGLLLVSPGVFVILGRCWMDFTATRDCLAYVDRAAHAPTLAIADEALTTAITAATERGWTSGNTGVFLDQTTNDIGFWFANLQACRADIAAAVKAGDQLTASNTLMRVRETLSRTPDSIEIYPHNGLWLAAQAIALVLAVPGGILIFVAIGNG